MTKQAKINVTRVYNALKRVYKLYSKEMLRDDKGNIIRNLPSKSAIREQYLTMRGLSFKARKEAILRTPFYTISKKTEIAEIKTYKRLQKKERDIMLSEFAKERGITKNTKEYKTEKHRLERLQDVMLERLQEKIGKVTTRDFAEIIQDDIMRTYNELKKQKGLGHSSEIKKEIAEMYFGS